uniref:Replication factor A C-terminal domain-containing protein n=1 Tax=Chenopodium quinoa TaxID=63459 RepID=A0A803N601_CHEQI
MASQRKFLDDTTTKNFKVKVRVAEKGHPQTSEKNTQYQSMLFEDDKDAQWRAKEDDIPFHLSLGSTTVIRSLDPKGESIYPRYQTLASIPSIPIDDDRHDILVLVLYVSEEPRRIVTSSNKETSVRDLMVIDHSTDQPMKVCTWNDLAGEQSESIVSNSDSFEVIGITALRPITRQDLALGTVYSCKACSRKDIHAAYRTTITFDVSDGTGSLELTAFTNVCDKLFRMPIQEIYEMKTMEQLEKFQKIVFKLATKHFLIKVGPTTALSKNKVLQWGLMGVYMVVEPTAATTEQDNSSNAVSGSESKKVVTDTSTKTAEGEVIQKTLLKSAKHTNSADTKETPHKDDLIDSSQEEEDACVFAESLIAASDNNQDSAEDFSQKRKRSGNEAELDFHTPTKEVIDMAAQDTAAKIVTNSSMESDQASLGAKEGKAIGSEEQVNYEFKLRKVKQERVTRLRTLILQDDDEEDSYNHATTLTKRSSQQ